jgi:type II secretory pathway component HofQ
MLTAKYNTKLDNHSEIGTAFRQSLGFTDRTSSVSGVDATALAIGTAWNTVGPGSDFSLLYGNIRNVIHALQEKNNVEILASPRVMVVSGKTASIESVEEIPYTDLSQTSQGGNMTSTQFKNIGIKLNVTATLMDDNSILMDAATEQSVPTGKLGGIPTVDTRKIQSTLLMKDGQILVIGGLRRKETQKNTNQLPILGDLPVIGLAFKATDTIKNSSELLVLLSPHTYKGESPTQEQMNKYNEITQRPLLTIPKDEADEKEKGKKVKPVSINTDKEKTKNTGKQVTDYLDEKGYLKARVAN